MKPFRILVMSPLRPHSAHTVRAANIVLYELISAFANLPGVSVGFLKVDQPGDAPETAQEADGRAELEKQGVTFLPEFALSSMVRRSKLRKIFFPSLEDFYPGVNGGEKQRLLEAVKNFSPDLIFIPWSEPVTALAADLPYPKYAYYGNPDPKSALAQASFNRRHRNLSSFEYAIKKRVASYLASIHIKIMSHYEMIGDVADNDVKYYRAHGLSQAHYIQNVWFDRYPNWRELRTSREKEKPLKIIGSIGKLSGTANTHGLELLVNDLLPELRRVMQKGSFEIHILGAGSPHPAIARLLSAPEFRLRGFVDDIDDEILSSSIFLCLNNASEYKVGHTRYLHAWSLGSCVIAHRDAALSMPEMHHDKNSLLGGTIPEMAKLIAEAVENKELRDRIGAGGYDTFRKFFVASHVVPKILQSFQEYKNRSV